MLSALVLSGCQLTGDNRAPITPTTPEQISSEVSRYQSIIDSAQGKPSVEALRAYISQEPLLTEQAAHQANIDGTWQMLTQMTPNQVEGIGVEENTSLDGLICWISTSITVTILMHYVPVLMTGKSVMRITQR